MNSQIILVSKEGTKYPTSPQLGNLSGLIYNVLQDYHETEEIPVPFVSDTYLQHILKFAEHHNFTPPEPPKKPLPSKNIRDSIPEWDAEFIENFNENEIIDLILATNYLDMKSLLDYCLIKIAAKFKDVTIEEVRKEYQITEEFTPEVEENLKIEYSWAMEAGNQD